MGLAPTQLLKALDLGELQQLPSQSLSSTHHKRSVTVINQHLPLLNKFIVPLTDLINRRPFLISAPHSRRHRSNVLENIQSI